MTLYHTHMFTTSCSRSQHGVNLKRKTLETFHVNFFDVFLLSFSLSWCYFFYSTRLMCFNFSLTFRCIKNCFLACEFIFVFLHITSAPFNDSLTPFHEDASFEIKPKILISNIVRVEISGWRVHYRRHRRLSMKSSLELFSRAFHWLNRKHENIFISL